MNRLNPNPPKTVEEAIQQVSASLIKITPYAEALLNKKFGKKYLVIPGYVHSKTDGDRHYISARQLMRLYQVQEVECVVYDPEAGMAQQARHSVRTQNISGLIRLEPRFDGEYQVPGKH